MYKVFSSIINLKTSTDEISVKDELSKSVEKHTIAPLFSNVQTRKEGYNGKR